MSKVFYRLQMKDGAHGERVAEHMLDQNRITAHEDFGGDDYMNLKAGNVVLVHKSSYPIALVEIVNRIHEDENLEKSLGVDYAVNILSWYGEVIKEDESLDTLWGSVPYTKTFSSLNSGNQTYDKVNKWYNYIIKKKNMEDQIKLLEYKRQIILQGPPGTGKTYTAKNIAERMIFGSVSSDKKNQKKKLEQSEQFKLIQFHPAYSYEDFVRGITAKSNGASIEYKTENKLLAEFASLAKRNYLNSHKEPKEIAIQKWVISKFSQYKSDLQERLNKGKTYLNNSGAFVVKVDEESIRCYHDSYTQVNDSGFDIPIDVIIEFAIKIINIADAENFDYEMRVYRKMFVPLLNDFKEFAGTVPDFKDSTDVEPLKSYIIIIDEINRANLPSVLGELIYALEYRGEYVESMYEYEGNRDITLPPNFYIIGTMNTADRSVGHIDYAIRRRFAFKTILPDESVITLPSAKEYFKEVKSLFEIYTASDFEKDDVMLGHSYFLAKDEDELKLKLKYEVVPILREYLKDGVLNKNEESVKAVNDFENKIPS